MRKYGQCLSLGDPEHCCVCFCAFLVFCSNEDEDAEAPSLQEDLGWASAVGSVAGVSVPEAITLCPFLHFSQLRVAALRRTVKAPSLRANIQSYILTACHYCSCFFAYAAMRTRMRKLPACRTTWAGPVLWAVLLTWHELHGCLPAPVYAGPRMNLQKLPACRSSTTDKRHTLADP
jgi:hypothetical protein